MSWLKEGSLDHVFKRPGEMVPATIMALEAYGKPWDTAAAVARKALDISADCPEAWHVLGLASDSVEEALQCFRRGVAARETALSDKEWQEAEGDPWGCYPLRGWLRCVIGEANCLRKLGAPAAAEALRQYRALAAMQSKTHGWCSFINFNYHLPEVYLRAGDLDGFDALWAADKEITIERTVFMSTQVGLGYSCLPPTPGCGPLMPFQLAFLTHTTCLVLHVIMERPSVLLVQVAVKRSMHNLSPRQTGQVVILLWPRSGPDCPLIMAKV